MAKVIYSFILLSILIKRALCVSVATNETLKIRWCGKIVDKCISESQVHCLDLKYRALDGSCNNAHNPTLGMALTSYTRLIPPAYGDGIYSMPLSKTGDPLPSARRISYQLFERNPVSDPELSLLNMQWGQLVTHDTSLRMPAGLPGLKPLEPQERRCCTGYGRYVIRNDSNPCFPIPVPKNDPVMKNRHCIDFERSVTDKDQMCPGTEDPAPAEQINGVTHFLDLSNVYGISEAQNSELREFIGGFMSTGEQQLWPPRSRDPSLHCALGNPGNICYEFGDIRGNQNPGLVVLQTLMLREHNRLARRLASINPHWDDETLYQEARRINIAVYQHITYYEWHPIIYNKKVLYNRGVIHEVHPNEYVNDYDPCVDPRSIQSAMHASFRYFHNQIVGNLQLLPESRQSLGEYVNINELMDRAGIIEEGRAYDNLLRGMCTQHAALTDRNYDPEIGEHFILGAGSRGRDLRTFDIQRDRDHGLPRYNAFREYCGLPKATSWRDYSDFMAVEDIAKLKSVYKSFEDVDLSVGGAFERHENGSLVGPTFMCINLLQFENLRRGDHYFYENGEQPYPFTQEQLGEIRNVTIARLLCDNSNVESMQREAFKGVSSDNPLVPCSEIPGINLEMWQEEILYV